MSEASGSSGGLSKLPPEIWGDIASCFQLEPIDVGTYHPPQNFLANRACLRNLCLTNHTFATAAKPFLYETIILYADSGDSSKGPESLVQLLRTLVGNTVLQRYVKHLACALTLWPPKNQFLGYYRVNHFQTLYDGNNHYGFVLLAWKNMRDACLANLQPAERQLFVNAGLLEPSDQTPAPQTWPYSHHVAAKVRDAIQLWNDNVQTAQKLLAILLCFTPRLQTLLLQGSAHQHTPMRPFSDLLEYFSSQQSGRQGSVLPFLSAICLQPGPLAVEESSWTGVQVCQNLLSHLPSLRRLDQWRSASYITAQDSPNNQWVNGLEEINITSGTNAGAVAGFVGQAHSLRTLRFQGVNLGYRPHNLQPMPPQVDLNHALLQRAPTLARLSLTTMDEAFQWQQWRLSCLPQLPLVEELEIDYSMLVRASIPGEIQVPDLLPPNLRELTIVFHNGCTEHFDMFMLTFSMDLPLARSQGRLKHLRKVHIDVFSVSDTNNRYVLARLDSRLALMLETGCICTYTLNRGKKPNT